MRLTMENLHPLDDELEHLAVALCRAGQRVPVLKLLGAHPAELVTAPRVEAMLTAGIAHAELCRAILEPYEAVVAPAARSRLVHLACRLGLPDTFALLADQRGWPVRALDDDGHSAFHLACRGGCVALCRRLVTHYGLDPKLVTDTDETGLHCVLRSGSLESTRYLLEELRFDPVKTESASARSSLVLSKGGTLRGSFDVYERGGDAVTHAAHNQGWTLLHYACASGSLEVVRYLMSTHYASHAQVSAADASGQTALHVAASTGCKELLLYLMAELRLSPNVADCSGRTPLHVACERADLDAVEVLLSNGARPVATHAGAMPYDLIHPSRPAHDQARFLCESFNPIMAYHAIPWSALERFCVEENKLGNGKCGTVYRGELHGTPVAIKTFVDGERFFKHEIGVLSRVHHPSIVCFLAASLDGTMSLVMEYLSGTCRDAIAAGAPWSSRVEWLRDMACAVEWLHNQKPFILHRGVCVCV